MNQKIKSLEELIKITQELKQQGKKIATTNGSFDLLHLGHIDILQKAKSFADVLIVLINSDSSIKKLKGEKRPIISEQHRALMLAGLESVDYITIFYTDNPLPLLKQIRPNFHIKGGTFIPEKIYQERKLIEFWKGKHITLPILKGFSTTNTINNILKTHQDKIPKKSKAIFLDRDGTINIDIGYLHNPYKFQFKENTFRALKNFQSKGYKLIIITNQAGVAKGLYTEEDIKKINNHMTTLLRQEGITINDVFYCPHHPTEGNTDYTQICNCRKPAPGMILQAAKIHNIDLTNSWMIGDKISDIEAGKSAGCRTILLDSNFPHSAPEPKFKDLLEASNHIFNLQNATSKQNKNF